MASEAEGGPPEERGVSFSAADVERLARIDVGTRISVYWPNDDASYPGVVAARHDADDKREGHCPVTVRYDDGDVETLDLGSEVFRILDGGAAAAAATDAAAATVKRKRAQRQSSNGDDMGPLDEPTPRGDRSPEPGPPDAFLLRHHDFEIYWGEEPEERGGGWRLYFPDRKKIQFYSYSFAAGRCEVEWDDEGRIYNTYFRKARPRKRRKAAKADTAQARSPPKKSATKMPSTNSAETPPPDHDNDHDSALGTDPWKPHYITKTLGMTRKEVISTLPEEMVKEFGDCCWIPWKGIHRPAFVLSPFDVSGDGGIVEEWTRVYSACKKGGTLSQMPHLVYWYEEGWSSSKGRKAFGLERRGNVYSYDTGIASGWDRPSFVNKVDDPFTHGTLTEREDLILIGIAQMKKDQQLPKANRGGPMFFPQLRDQEKEASGEMVDALERKYDSWKSSHKYEVCVSQGVASEADTNEGPGVGSMTCLELCAGEEVMSQALQRHGFATTTLDNDLKRSATTQLSLEELEDRIVDGRILHHPHLHKSFSLIWAAPECRTWSRAQSGRYRNKDFIDGYQGRALEADAQQARRDIESLVNILSFYKTKNPALVMVIENPVGYLQHHPVSKLFHDILGLELVKISYCQFSTVHTLHPQKDTHLWTNSELLIHQFGHGEFECKKGKPCWGRRANGKHRSKVQDLPDKCSAYPPEMCSFIAPLLFAESVKGTLGVKNATARTLRRGSTTDSEAQDESSDGN